LNGASLAKYSVYKKLDYIVLVDAPFVERQKRVENRKDRLVTQDTLLERDKRFRLVSRQAKRIGKKIDIKIKNIGTIEELQDIATQIYEREILAKKEYKEKSMKEKYGGYKAKTVKITKLGKIANRKKDDLSK
jgi:hypothetical protein